MRISDWSSDVCSSDLPENTEGYVWGDRTLRNVRCKTCGIITHWEPLESEPGARHGVNLRNFDPGLLESVVVRRFDGAATWTFLDWVPLPSAALVAARNPPGSPT